MEEVMNGILIREVETKNIMTKSSLPVGGYSVNPYVGCTHACKYCYASFMKRFTGHPKICKEIRRQIAEVKDSDNIAEIGLGLNPACMFNGDFEEEKKARGTCHIAMGNGFYYGQPARSTVHIDMVQYNPTVIFDEGTPEEVLIVKDGKVVCLGDK